jgi:hypothetical protein
MTPTTISDSPQNNLRVFSLIAPSYPASLAKRQTVHPTDVIADNILMLCPRACRRWASRLVTLGVLIDLP